MFPERIVKHTFITVGLALSFFLFPVIPAASQQLPTPMSTREQLAADVARVPCKKQDRLPAVRTLFQQMGAAATDITIPPDKNVQNVVIKLPGKSQESITIGAHYDFVDKGCGAIDNWTGIVAIAHLYRTIRAIDHEKTVTFVAFDKEENGLVGSRAMVNTMTSEETARQCAMINIDSLGLAVPFALGIVSSEKLIRLAAAESAALQLPFEKMLIVGADADSSSFLVKGIPALTISGLTANWNTVIHSGRDKADRVNSTSVFLGYQLALAVWQRIDDAPCTAYRL
jgi:Zn-dependent M28 family amino/carboxypeptidase